MAGWIVKREDRTGTSYLIGGPFVPSSIRSWLAWGGKTDAYVFPTKSAAREAVRGQRSVIVERLSA